MFRYYAGWATKIHGETLNLRDSAFTFTLRQPLGVVGAIVPWNFPFLLAVLEDRPRAGRRQHARSQAGLPDAA